MPIAMAVFLTTCPQFILSEAFVSRIRTLPHVGERRTVRTIYLFAFWICNICETSNSLSL